MFIRNGELVTISRIKIKIKIKNKFFGSLRFRILILFLAIGIIPCFILGYVIMDGYENRAVSAKIIDVQNQYNILSKQLIDSGYMDDPELEPVNTELEQLSSIYAGRILVVDENFTIVKDTFEVAEAKTIVTEGILQCFEGKSTTKYEPKKGYIEMIIPVKDAETQEISGAILSIISTEGIAVTQDEIEDKAFILMAALVVVLGVLSVFFSAVLVRPFGRITHSIEELTEGYAEENISVSDYTETQLISEAFNKMLGKLRAIDISRQEFVSNVSHELKTPLTSMKVLADSLLMQEDAPVELYKEFMTDITEEIDRENKIINDLLSLVKMDKAAADLNIKAININELLELILKRLRPIAAKRNIELVFESFRPVTAEVDEVKLTLAISNLVENAIKYNVENGWVRIYLNADHKYFYVKVADSGIGIPEEAIEHIFERFYRVDKSHSREIGGTGLGLSITRSAILMHRGAIRVYSKEGEGTTFTIRVPLNYIA